MRRTNSDWSLLVRFCQRRKYDEKHELITSLLTTGSACCVSGLLNGPLLY